jgi:hypothetical protein
LQLEAWWIAAWFLLLVWFVPLFGDRWFTSIEKCFSAVAAKRLACILLLFLATITIRLFMLPVIPCPRPVVHDEYSYLLQADIFVHGRLAFPPHPMSRYFETFYVNFQPTYSSIYPPAQAAVLALGQLLGNPWIGVLLSTAAMVAAILWMLQGWFPPWWALLGAIFVLFRLAIFSYWMNSYWGGSVAALGAALILGALPRVKRQQRLRDALLLGLGIFILANSRPFEGFIFCLPIACILFFWLVELRRQKRPIPSGNVFLPILACVSVTLIFTLYYNWRLTNDPFEFPRSLYYQQYFSVSPFIWGNVIPPLHYSNPELDEYFNGFMRGQYHGLWDRLKQIELPRIYAFWVYFLGALLSAPFLSLPWLVKDRRIRFALWQFLFCALGMLSVVWFYPHYAAPALCVLLVILVQAFRHLRRWQCGGRPIGIGWTRAIVSLTLAMLPICLIEHILRPHAEICLAYDYDWQRAGIVSELQKTPGDHLIIVRYSPDHDVQREWVYNAADIDHSRIVWAREIPGVDLSPLLAYFPTRKVWLAEPDAKPPLLHPYSDSLLTPSH